MAIASMTGFARETGVTGVHQWAWEAKSVNGRGLDIRLRVPPGFDAAGESARQALQRSLQRGQCQVSLALTRQGAGVKVRLNRAALEQLLAEVAELDWPKNVAPPTGDGLIAVRGIVEVEEEGGEGLDAALAQALGAGAERLAAALAAARAAEGAKLLAVLDGQIERMAALTAAAEACPARRPEAIRERLRMQVEALLETPGALDPLRLHQEAALIAAKADIREELDRLAAHLDAVRTLLAQGGTVGRKLDFLAQELGREANTLCAKANDIELSRIGLDLKAVIEQFREQVQNVE